MQPSICLLYTAGSGKQIILDPPNIFQQLSYGFILGPTYEGMWIFEHQAVCVLMTGEKSLRNSSVNKSWKKHVWIMRAGP